MQGSLRSASDVYKKGGNVTMKYRDQLFRMHFDNRRLLQWEASIPPSIEVLVDSTPITGVNQCKNLRYIGSLIKKKTYGKFLSGGVVGLNKYKSKDEIAVRVFVKGLVSSPPKFNLPTDVFLSNIEVVEYIKLYNPGIKMTPDRVSRYKSLVLKHGKIQKTKQTEAFVAYVLQKFPMFDAESFYTVTKKDSVV